MDILGHNLNVVCEVDGVISSQFRYPGLSPLHHLLQQQQVRPHTRGGAGWGGAGGVAGFEEYHCMWCACTGTCVHLSTHTC